MKTNVKLSAVQPWPANLTTHGLAFFGTVFDGRYVWMIPRHALSFVSIDTWNNDAMATVAVPLAFIDSYFYGGVFDGQLIWCTSATISVVVTLNVVTRQAVVENITWPSTFGGLSATAFDGGAFDGQAVWFAPCNSNPAGNITRIQVSNRTATFVYPPAYVSWAGGDMYSGVLFDGTLLWFVPYQMSHIVMVNAKNFTVATIDPAAYTTGTGNPSWFVGGTFDGVNVWLIQSSLTAATLIINVHTFVVKALSGIPATMVNGGAVFDGESVWIVPQGATGIAVVNATTHVVTTFPHTAIPFALASNPFVGAVYTGRAIYYAPQTAQYVLKISSSESVLNRSISDSRTSSCSASQSSSSSAGSQTVSVSRFATASKTSSSTHTLTLSRPGTASRNHSVSFLSRSSTETYSGETSSFAVTISYSTISRLSFTQSAITNRSASWSRASSTLSRSSSLSSPNKTVSFTLSLIVAQSRVSPSGALVLASSYVAVASAGFALGSLSSGTSAARLSILLTLASCADGDASEPPSTTTHPLGFGILAAGATIQYDAGLILGDASLTIALTALHFLGVVVCALTRIKSEKGDRWYLAAGTVRFPGFSNSLHMYVLPLLAQAGTRCVMQGTNIGRFIGVWALILTFTAVAYLAYATIVKLADVMRCNEAPLSSTEPWLVRPRSVWSLNTVAVADVDSDVFCACYGAYFEDFNFHARWWLCVEVFVSVCCGIIGGLSDTINNCLVAQALAVVPNFAYVFLVIVVRPHQRPLDTIVALSVGILLLLSSTAVCFESATIATSAALTASAVGCLPVLYTPYKWLQRVRLRRQVHRRLLEEQRMRRVQLLSLPVTELGPSIANELIPTPTTSADNTQLDTIEIVTELVRESEPVAGRVNNVGPAPSLLMALLSDEERAVRELDLELLLSPATC